jgi:DNA helicase-4
MGIAVIAWQLFIIFTIFISGRSRGWVAVFWVIWTLVQVYALPLSVVQFVSIWLGYKLAKPRTGGASA